MKKEKKENSVRMGMLHGERERLEKIQPYTETKYNGI